MNSNSPTLRKNNKTSNFAIKSKLSGQNLFSWTWTSVQFSVLEQIHLAESLLSGLFPDLTSLCSSTMACCILLHLLHGTEVPFILQLQWYIHLYCYFIPSLYLELLTEGEGGKKENTFILFIKKRKYLKTAPQPTHVCPYMIK